MSLGSVFVSLGVSGAMLLGGALGCTGHGGQTGTVAPGQSGAAQSGTGQGGGPSRPPVDHGGGAPYDDGTVPVDQFGGVIETKLPAAGAMTGVVAVQGDDSVSITFDPIDGALDYRVYPLPADADITLGENQHFTVKDAIYRCAGNRESPAPTIDDGTPVGGSAIHTMVANQTVVYYKRSLAEATLGYVYTQPAEGLIPVYAIGDADPNADSTCYFARWGASRVKKYTTSEAERTQLIGNLGRDDGIAFYVPAAADDSTTNVYFSEDEPGTPNMRRTYFTDGPEGDFRKPKTRAFSILKAAAAGSQPLMRVFYGNQCGQSHDELVAGKERFNRAYKQGDALPWWSLLWTGITGPTTLVVEALDAGCPYQGFPSAQSLPAIKSTYGDVVIDHQPFSTLADMKASSSTGEVFINGQHEAASKPRAIARAFIKVKPTPHPQMDFFAGFSPNDTPETFTPRTCGAPDGNCYQTWRQESPTFDQFFSYIDSGVGMDGLATWGAVLGEFRVSYADKGADSNGKYRLTAKQMATIDDKKFLHATMEVDAYSSARRYPQLIISDRPAPIQYTLDKGHSLILQPRAEINGGTDYPINYELQICNLVTWDVNQQCPVYDLHHIKDASGKPVHLAPNDEFGEYASVDHRVRFDIYTSTKRAYLFLEGKPYGCADLPDAGPPAAGPVTVTWGDVLYHSGVDHVYAFHQAHMMAQQTRHFDNLGFSSGVAEPVWDETRFPCASSSSLKQP
jgi:hypothetical protein